MLHDSLQFTMMSILEYTKIMNDIYDILINNDAHKIYNIASYSNFTKILEKMVSTLADNQRFYGDTYLEIIKTADIKTRFIKKPLKYR